MSSLLTNKVSSITFLLCCCYCALFINAATTTKSHNIKNNNKLTMNQLQSMNIPHRGKDYFFFDNNNLLLWPQPKNKNQHLFLRKQLKQMKISSSDEKYEIKNVHLSFTQKSNEMIVTFHTSHYNETEIGKPLIKLGTSIEQLRTNPIVYYIGSVTNTYGDSSETGFDHSVLLNNLQFKTVYYYQCGFGLNKNKILIETNEIYHFTTRSEESPNEVTVLLYGDMGILQSYNNRQQIGKRVKEFNGNGNFFIYHVGDIGYADDYPGYLYQYVWNKWFEEMDQIHPFVSYMTTVGNHERGPKHKPFHDYELEFKAYNNKFFMPLRNISTPEGKPYGHNMWYHFDFGPIRFVTISTETNFDHCPYPEGNVQGDHLDYIKQALESVDRNKTPIVITLGHRPIYSTDKNYANENGNAIGETKYIKAAFEELFYKNHVDLYIAGHVHTYERTYPVYKEKVESKEENNYHNLRYPIHIVDGAGGCIEGLNKDKDFPYDIDWNVKRYTKDEGYGLMNVKRLEKSVVLTWKFYNAGKDELIDSFTLTKDL
ncbi:hypothetical protein ABK040_007553 [Willaertia magna]